MGGMRKSAVIIGADDKWNLGRMAREHQRAYEECGVKVTGTANRTDWVEEIDSLEPGTGYVSVCSYDDAHADQICYALKCGHAVIAEKPLCLTEDDLKRIYKLATPETLYCNLPLLEKEWPDATASTWLSTTYNWGRASKLAGWRSKCQGYSIVLGAGIHVASLGLFLKRRAIIAVEVSAKNSNRVISDVEFADKTGGRILIYCDSDDGNHYHGIVCNSPSCDWKLKNRESDKTAGIKRFIEGKYDRYHNSFAAHSVCFAIERALKSGKRETVEYLT